jgi:hypothetical protein
MIYCPPQLETEEGNTPSGRNVVWRQTMDQVSAGQHRTAALVLVWRWTRLLLHCGSRRAAPFERDADSCSHPVPQFPGIEQRSGFPVHTLVTTVTELPSPSTATTVHGETLPITLLKIGLTIVGFLLLFCWQHRGKACSLQYSNVTLLLVVNLAYTAGSSGIRSSGPSE